MHLAGQLLEAVYRPNPKGGFSDQASGSIEVRGWRSAMSTLPISAPLTLLRFAPDGSALLEAELLPAGAEQVSIIWQDKTRAPLVAVPGHIVRLSWPPDASAVVVHSIQGERLTLTLVRLRPTILAAVVADLPAADYAGALVPLTWDTSGLLWVAPDQNRSTALWSAPLTSLIPERKSAMDARALTRLPDGTLRVVTVQDSTVVIGRYQGDIFIGETTVPRVPPSADLTGMWQGNQLLLQGGGQAWLLDVKEGDR
jgi:hypothetical protein